MEATTTVAPRAKSSHALTLTLALSMLVALCAPVAAQAAGTITATAAGARSATNLDSDYGAPLAGVAFRKALWTADPTTATWTSLCTTGASGACTSASLANGRYLVRQDPTGGPVGWRALTQVAWGGGSSGSSPAREYVGDVTVSNGSNATVYPSIVSPSAPATGAGSGAFLAAKNNPPLPVGCGLDVLLLLDRSGSIESQKATYRTAARQFVSSLSATPTRLKITSFSDTVTSDQASFLNLENVADVATANTKIDNVYSAPSGSTNWDGGMNAAANAGVDVVVFITDGNPTYRNSPNGTTSGNVVNLLDLSFGVASANKVKTIGTSAGAGATILAVGAGTGVTPLNLAAVSGPSAGDDYVTSSVAGLPAKLQEIANRLCGARIHVRKLTDDGDPAAAKAGWTFAAAGSAPVTFTPGSVTTAGSPAEAVIAVDRIPAGGTTVTIGETQQAGYAFVASECRTGGFANVTSGGAITSTIGSIRRTEDWYCTFRNRVVVPELTVIKKVVNDDGGTQAPKDFEITVNDPGSDPAPFAGADSPGTGVVVDPGPYSVTEGDHAGYAVTYSAGCNSSLAIGQTKTCTVTNDDIAPVLTVIKHVVNKGASNAQASAFQIDVTATKPSRAHFPGSETGTSITLDAGSYSVDESGGPSTFEKTLSAGCAGTIAVGTTKTCTITNTKIVPRGEVVKQGAAFAYHGDTMTFTFEVTNPGTTPLSTVTVTDNRCAPVVGPTQRLGGNQDGTLDPGETWLFTCTVGVPAHTAADTTLVNTVTLAATDADGEPAADTDSHTTTIVHPAIAIDKTGPVTAQAGDAVLYTLAVTNRGDVAFLAANVSVGDLLCEAPPLLTTQNADATPGQLDPGDTWTYTCTVRTLVGQTVVDNVGTVSGTDPSGGHEVTDEDPATTKLTQPPVAPPPPPPEIPPVTPPVTPVAVTPSGGPVKPATQVTPVAAVAQTATARLTGPKGCVTRPFTVNVTGRGIAKVVFVIEGAKSKTVAGSASRTVFKLRISPRGAANKARRVTAKVTFKSATNTAPRTLRYIYLGCARQVVAPQFTG